MGRAYTIRKWEGDDSLSYAVFRTEAVRGTGRGVYFGDARPIVCDCSRGEAEYYMRQFEREDADQKADR